MKDLRGDKARLLHEYFGVDAKIVWDIISENLPALKKAVEVILKDMESG